MKQWTACQDHAGWHVEGVAENGGATPISAFGLSKEDARLIAAAPDLLSALESLVAPPAPAPVVAMARQGEESLETLTTCYVNRSGSCWTEE